MLLRNITAAPVRSRHRLKLASRARGERVPHTGAEDRDSANQTTGHRGRSLRPAQIAWQHKLRLTGWPAGSRSVRSTGRSSMSTPQQTPLGRPPGVQIISRVRHHRAREPRAAPARASVPRPTPAKVELCPLLSTFRKVDASNVRRQAPMHPGIGSQRSWSAFSEVALARTRLESRELLVEGSF